MSRIVSARKGSARKVSSLDGAGLLALNAASVSISFFLHCGRSSASSIVYTRVRLHSRQVSVTGRGSGHCCR